VVAEQLNEPRVIKVCFYWRCTKDAETYNRYGLTVNYCSERHRKAAERDPPPPGYKPDQGVPVAHRLDHPAALAAFELLISNDVKHAVVRSRGVPWANAVAKATQLLESGEVGEQGV
jgi:hypothetical protein